MTMVERVAAVLCDGMPGSCFKPPNAASCVCHEIARAAIEAMREPPPHIVQAGSNVSMEIDGNQVFHAWQAMIDAALAEDAAAKPDTVV